MVMMMQMVGVGWGWCSVVEFQGCATLVEAAYQGRQTVQPANPRNLATALAKIRDREIENQRRAVITVQPYCRRDPTEGFHFQSCHFYQSTTEDDPNVKSESQLHQYQQPN